MSLDVSKSNEVDKLPARQDADILLEELSKQLQLLNQKFPGVVPSFAIDPQGRVRILIDVAGIATPVTQSGTWNVGTVTTLPALPSITTFIYGQLWEMIQRSNVEYNECQRSKMTFS